MPRLEPALLPVLIDVGRALRELEIPFGVVGALVPALLLEVAPPEMTNEADVTVVVENLAGFEALKDKLSDYHFTRTATPHRMIHRSGRFLDILPFSETIAPDGRLELQAGIALNMAGFRHVVPNTVPVQIEGGPRLPVAPLPLYALLKLIAFSDRKAAKDLTGIRHCLEHYLENEDRRYIVEYNGQGVPYDFTSAHLLGLDAQPFLDEPVSAAVRTVLEQFEDPESHLVAVAAAAERRFHIDDERRTHVFELFRWYRLGTGL